MKPVGTGLHRAASLPYKDVEGKPDSQCQERRGPSGADWEEGTGEAGPLCGNEVSPEMRGAGAGDQVGRGRRFQMQKECCVW